MFMKSKKKLSDSSLKSNSSVGLVTPKNTDFKFYPATHVQFQSTVIRLTEILECKSYEPTKKDTYIIKVKRNNEEDIFFEYSDRNQRDKEFENFSKLSTSSLSFVTGD